MKKHLAVILHLIVLSIILTNCGSSSGDGTGDGTIPGTPPSLVSGIEVAAGNGQATIRWKPATGAANYNIYWSTATGVTKATGTQISGLTGTSFTQTGLTNGISYYYVVTAQNDYEESNESSEARVMPGNFVSINIIKPLMSALAGKTLQVVVTHTSTYQMQGITAAVADRQVDLVFSSEANCDSTYGCRPGWSGSISLNGLTRGEKLLIVTGTDVFGNKSMSSVSFNYDQSATITITDPQNYTVARPQLQITASCSDDAPTGCVSLKVTISDTSILIAAGQDSINQNVSFSAYDGEQVDLLFEAKDSAGQFTRTLRTVYVESSTKLVDVASVDGTIWDVTPDRILFLDTSTDEDILKIRDRSSGVDTVVMKDIDKIPTYGFLTPKGAIFVEKDKNPENFLMDTVYDWRDNVLVDLGHPNSFYSLKVKGNYAIWNQQPLLFLLDLISGISTTISNDAGNTHNDVASNGDVAYWQVSPYQIFRYSGGVTTQLTNDATLWNTYPLTDGVNVIYRKHTPCCDNQTFAISLYTASGELTLAPARSQEPYPGTGYQVNNGWAAFTIPGVDGVLQVWLRSPAGDLTQESFFGMSSRIKALGPNGDLLWVTANRTYFDTPGAMPVDIGSSLCKPFYQDGQWYGTIGRSLFRIEP